MQVLGGDSGDHFEDPISTYVSTYLYINMCVSVLLRCIRDYLTGQGMLAWRAATLFAEVRTFPQCIRANTFTMHPSLVMNNRQYQGLC
jgi:hypothetical protein